MSGSVGAGFPVESVFDYHGWAAGRAQYLRIGVM
jgi:hypothetical protein